MEGMGTDEHTLIEILCSKSNKEVKEIVDAYERCKYLMSMGLEQWFFHSQQQQHYLVAGINLYLEAVCSFGHGSQP
jgi:hypothetical protein